MNRTTIIGLVLVIVIIIGAAIAFARHPVSQPNVSEGPLNVVAAENFWGSIASQIGGTDAQVTAIVTDPNADPHDYETTTADAETFANAQYVILNGVGYDSWGDKLLAGNPATGRKVLVIGDLVGKADGDNPHLWYDPDYVNQAAKQMEADMASLDPAHASDYQKNYENLLQNLSVYQNQIADIKNRYGGTKVAATEDIFVYLANAAGLDLVSPPDFTEAIAEGTDPSAESVATFENQLKSGEVKVLVYNTQTVTPLTENVKSIAEAEHIPIVGITETLTPANASFEDWMGGEIANLAAALAGATSTAP